ncbi:flagellar brake protein [Pseudoalteromonas sp. McH1-7]|uniref:PilZ domain-containing protein n=1 Tax=Pseudoalteromonas sp. McH1-7 TaxID=2745574 RepID=UPI0015912FED|nr:flagellar brake protein [Pseudoalteromonas sp. McH1-7]NUZ11591.1 flagellar brake protein [Pseudoalteromonas sp. McH1-7]
MLRTREVGQESLLTAISAGSLVDIEICLPASSKRIKTEYVGLLQGAFLILNHPNPKRLGAALDFVMEGTTVIVRALLENGDGQVIAFRSQIKAVSVHPARLIFLYPPEKIQTYKLRAQSRVPTLIPAHFQHSNKNEVGVIKDISLSGLQLDLTSADMPDLQEGAKCSVLIEGKEGNQITLEGDVRKIRQHDDILSLGIHLTSEPGVIRGVLKDYLIDLSIFQDHRDT